MAMVDQAKILYEAPLKQYFREKGGFLLEKLTNYEFYYEFIVALAAIDL